MNISVKSIFDMPWQEVRGAGPYQYASLHARTTDTFVRVLRTTTAGRTAIRYTPLVHDADHPHDYARRFLKKSVHAWDAGYITIIDKPIMIDLRYGTLFGNKNGEVYLISESLYGFPAQERAAYIQSTLKNPEFCRISADCMIGELSADEIFVPLLNNKSTIYFHMLSESMLQSYVFSRIQIDRNIVFLSPAKRKSVENIVFHQTAQWGQSIKETSRRFVWVPRAAFYSCFQQHARLNPDFRTMIEQLRLCYDESSIISSVGVWNKAGPINGRIYVSRLGAAARPLENEEDLISLVREFGFAVVDPGRLSFGEQIRVFSNAAHVIGPHGAGMTNAAFCLGGTTLLEFRGLNRSSQSPSRNETYRRLSACMSLEYGCLMFGNEVGSDRWEIDLEPVRRVLQRIAS